MVTEVAVGPEGKLVASAGADQAVRLWDLASGQQLRSISVPSEYVSALQFSPDGRWLAVGTDEGLTKIWDVATGREIRTLSYRTTPSAGSGRVARLRFSPDARLIATGSDLPMNQLVSDTPNAKGVVTIWEVSSGAPLRTFVGHTGGITSIAFSSDGRWLVSGSRDCSVRVWEVASGSLAHTMTGHLGAVMSVAFSADSHQVLSGSADFALKLWDAATGKELRTLDEASDTVGALTVDPNEHRLASGDGAGTVKIWDTTTWRQMQSWRGIAGTRAGYWAVEFQKSGLRIPWLKGHAQGISDLTFGSHARRIVSATTWTGEVHVHELETQQ